MSDPQHVEVGGADGPEAANSRFLTASLLWLRLLLRRAIGEAPVPPEPVGPAPRGTARTRLFHRPGPAPAADGHPATAPAAGGGRVTEQQIEAAARAVREAEEASPPPPLVELADRLGLSRFERDTLLLCVATELDPSITRLYARAQGDEWAAHPTFGLALALLPDPAWDALSPQGGLRYWRLLEITRTAGQGLVAGALRADERIVNHVKGLNHLDDRLALVIERLDPEQGTELPPSQQDVADAIVRAWRRPGTPLVQLVGPDGPDGAGRRAVAARAAAACGLVACRLPAGLLPVAPAELDELARLWQRESMLLPLALYLDTGDAGPGESGSDGAGPARFLARTAGGARLLVGRESRSDLGLASAVLDVAPPTPAERAEAWRAEYGPGEQSDALAAQFGLELSAIREVAAVAGGDPAAAWRACRLRTRPRLEALAQRLETRATWDDIVLAADSRRALGEIADQLAHRTTVYETWGFGERVTRGLGLGALFAGPSGAGKTMAAEVLAGHLRLDLYRIDLSAVVSKYIGETEKNLGRLFDAAEGGGSILFFDEADALFGKRSEVKDAHDRYANIEVNYLLQRMEAFRGLAVLATNLRSALDSAFLRRLRFIVEFEFPGPDQRHEIWEKAFPPAAPCDALDYARLARLQASGGMIRNIALNAAFLAASAGGPITMPQVLASARGEFLKLELPMTERDFAWEGTPGR
ncbi:ATP-binding protein [Kitasatospora sp. NPDC059327]|uniref:ATP-binding protein n=1 Tax=Kitasatospora sp. NPDC059327 TaxID=3346803 RepID=UPI0036A68D08